MGEVVFFGAARRSPPPLPNSAQQMPYETYVAYQQAEAAFSALYLGRPLLNSCPNPELVQRHWATVQELAAAFSREKSLSREQVLKLLLQASLDAAVGAEP